MKNIVVLGSTGSIGTQTLDVIGRFPDRFQVAALAVRSSTQKLKEQVRRFRPLAAVVFEEESYRELARDWNEQGTKLLCGMEGLLEIVSLKEADTVVTAMVGMIGLRPTVRILRLPIRRPLSAQANILCVWQRSGACGYCR